MEEGSRLAVLGPCCRMFRRIESHLQATLQRLDATAPIIGPREHGHAVSTLHQPLAEVVNVVLNATYVGHEEVADHEDAQRRHTRRDFRDAHG